MLRNNYLKYAATLAIICLAASGLLGVVYNITRPKILYQQSLEERNSLKEVFPKADSFEPVKKTEDVLYYKALDAEHNVLGYAFKASRRGYSSDIITMVGMGKDGTITRIKVLSQNETPGLGTRITEVIQKTTLIDILLRKAKLAPAGRPWFQEQFSDKKIDELDSVNTITGATITSRAVIESVREKAEEIMGEVKNGR